MRWLAQLILLWCISIQASPPQALVSGRIVDAGTGEPLPGTSIVYLQVRGTTSDQSGYFQLRVQPGAANIIFRYMGYRVQIQSIYTEPGDSLWLDVSLVPEVTQMNQVVISAGKVEQRAAEATVSVSIIEPAALSTGHISQPTELMNRTPGIEVLDGQASIRGGSGFSYGAGSRVMALVDGLPALAADAGSIRWSFLPLENISQVEVIKGASSVLYGSSALNGMIHFRMAEPGPVGKTSFFVESGVFDRPRNGQWIWWDTPRIFASTSFSHQRKYQNTGISLGGFLVNDQGYRRLNDLRLGRMNLRLSRQHPSLPTLSYGLNLQGGFNQKRDFVLWENAWDGALRQSPSTENLLHGSFWALDPFISLKPNEQLRHDLRLRLQGTSNLYPEQFQNNSQARSLYAEYQVWNRISPLVSLNSGLVQYTSRVISNFYGNHSAYNAALYSQADFSPGQRLNLVAGFRLEYNSMDGQDNQLTPLFRTGINYRAADLTFVRASFGQGYRYPSIAERHAATTLGVVRIFPNTEILPESGWNFEAGIKQGFLNNSMDAMVDLAFFYTQNKDLIEYVFGIYPLPGNQEYDFGFRAANIEYSRVYGTELDILLHFSTGRLSNTLGGGYVFMYPVEYDPRSMKNTGVFLKFRRKHALTLNLNSSFGHWDFGLHLSAKSRILNIDDVFLLEMTREQVLPGFYDYWLQNNNGHFVGDLSLGYSFSKHYRFSLAIKNLLNEEYMGRPGDIQPHRNFSIRFTGTW